MVFLMLFLNIHFLKVHACFKPSAYLALFLYITMKQSRFQGDNIGVGVGCFLIEKKIFTGFAKCLSQRL